MEDFKSVNEFSFQEPNGHIHAQSKIERYWDKFNGPYGLHRQRVPQFSVFAGMTHYPMEYIMRRFQLKDSCPSDEWIESALNNFVKIEFASRQNSSDHLPENWPPKIDETIEVSERFLDDFLLGSEWPYRVEIEYPEKNTPDEIAGLIYELLCNPKIGSGKNRNNNDVSKFVKNIVPALESKSRLLFVLLGFPFKDQNRFRVPYSADMPDFSEITFMIRLFNLTQAMYQIHPFGVDIVILSDGDLYKDIFGISALETKKYMDRLLAYRNRMNLQGAISFLSLKELIDRSSEDSRAWKLVDLIEGRLKQIVERGKPEITEKFDVLVSAMKWNMNLNDVLSSHNDKEAWEIIRSPIESLDKLNHESWHKVNAKAQNSAYKYAAVNLMLRWTNLIFDFFPDAIRGTVHAKEGQFALANSTESFAWNGVAFSKDWPKSVDDIRVVPFLSIGEYPKIKKVVFNNSDIPCFYTLSRHKSNIEAAKKVLPKDGWTVDDINGRELVLSDLEEFISLGKSDANFTWERKLQTENYFTGLFQFRISHYKKHGFGVHGIWRDNKLIGQFGLQVLDEDNDQLELVIFLGKKYTRNGIGLKLVDYIIDKCRKLKIAELFGIVRIDNEAGIGLLGKFRSHRKRTVKHFNQEGVLYLIDLNQ